jgi:hypothetical protein
MEQEQASHEAWSPASRWGLDKQCRQESLKYWTFCRLCECKAEAGTQVYVETDPEGKQYVIHVRCPWMQDQELTKTQFLAEVRMRPGSRTKTAKSKKRHEGDDLGYCNFCHLLTSVGQEYVKDGKYLRYHPTCWTRLKQVQKRARENLR